MSLNLRPDHFTILTDDLAKTEAFYVDLLEFTPGPRPEMSSPGVWLYSGDKPILHVVGVGTLPQERRGVLDHMAFRGDGMEAFLDKLKARDIPYHRIRTAEPWKQWQVFFEGPNGEKVEVDFDMMDDGS